ncbi:hypothetical protein ACHAXH_005266 [Discostella pseudostelligera]
MMIHLLLLVALLSAFIPLGILLYRIVFPTILSFPWQLPSGSSSASRRKHDKSKTVVFAGSFNPPHWGHLVMIRYLAERYGRVICCIGVNPNKRYDVTPQARAQILREMLSGGDDGSTRCKNVQVEVVTGYIWRYARTQNASLFYRGVRTWSADGHDERQLQILNSWGPLLLGPLVWPLQTIFLEGDPKYRHVSSTVTRQLCAKIRQRRLNGEEEASAELDELTKLVPEWVMDTIVDVYGR